MGDAAHARTSAEGESVERGPWERPAIRIGRIQLAHEPLLRLGPLTIEAALRRIAHDDGREQIVEPRVMQVLVALVRGGGAILARDDLIHCCWDGRVVGDDAINRVISRLRRLAETIGAGIFRIETINKVGYRLVGGPPAPRPAAPAAAGESKRALESVYGMVVVRGLVCSEVMAELIAVPLVGLIHKLTGPIDLLIRLDGGSIAEIEESRAAIARVAGVESVSTAVVLERYVG
jgi:DNA-binding winged helix-turn-helix (wHTH) protein